MRVRNYTGSAMFAKARGVMLSELMISLALSSVLMLILMQTFLMQKRQLGQTMSTLEQSYDFAYISDWLRDDILQAGFTPCRGISRLISSNADFPKQAIVDLQTNTEGSVFLKTARMASDYVALPQLSAEKRLIIPQANFKAKKIVIADCEHAELHLIEALEHRRGQTIITLRQPLIYAYPEELYLGAWLEDSWQLRRAGGRDASLLVDSGHLETISDQFTRVAIKVEKTVAKRFIEIVLQDKKGQSKRLFFRMRNG